MHQDNQPTVSPLPHPVPAHTGLRGWVEKSQRNAFILGISGILLGVCLLCGFMAIVIGATGSKTTGNTVLTIHTTVTKVATVRATSTTAIATSPVATPMTTATVQTTGQQPTTVPIQISPPTATAVPAPLPPTAISPPPPATATAAPKYPAVGGNPYGYTLVNTGKLIYSPPGDICNYLNCIASFWQHTNGYVDECTDGTFSHSGGVKGACSQHGGEQQPLFAP